mmetsp:Transcript_57333/g.153239  ORF Transcript_57333/g.153239 Transcript_57333/m.153239 type:complete len:243 (-) Transcript_57333:237-965(-)
MSRIALQQALRRFDLNVGCTRTQLKSRYLELAKSLHPDGNPGATEQFKQLQQDYNDASELMNENPHLTGPSTSFSDPPRWQHYDGPSSGAAVADSPFRGWLPQTMGVLMGALGLLLVTSTPSPTPGRNLVQTSSATGISDRRISYATAERTISQQASTRRPSATESTKSTRSVAPLSGKASTIFIPDDGSRPVSYDIVEIRHPRSKAVSFYDGRPPRSHERYSSGRMSEYYAKRFRGEGQVC